jgi:microcin C transport system substrate-binding protein
LFTQAFTLPKSDGTGDIRSQLRQALRLLKSAGWENQAGKLTQTQTGRVMRFEILHVSPAFERITLPFVKNLQRLGIEATVRTVDTAQYQQRLDTYDFDMIVHTWGQSLSPGNEQRNFWHSEAAAVPGTQNLAGIREPVVDSLIDLVIAAPDRDSLITRTRALDRVLLWGYYVVPQWHISAYRVLYWDKFGIPDITPKYSLGFDTWWIDPEREARLAQRKGAVR